MTWDFVSGLATLLALIGIVLTRLHNWRCLLRTLALVGVAVACWQPRWGTAPISRASTPATVWLAVDVSRSMAVPDTPRGSRLQMAQSVLIDLLPQLRGHWIGILAVGATPVLVVPPTTDETTLRAELESLTYATAPPGVSRWELLADWLQQVAAANAPNSSPPDDPNANREPTLLLLVTDGSHHLSIDSLPKAMLSSWQNIPTVIVGVGDPASQQAIPTIEPNLDRPTTEIRDRQNQPIRAPLADILLQTFVVRIGGVYVPLRTQELEWSSLFPKVVAPKLRQAARNSAETSPHQEPVQRYSLFVLVALLLWVLQQPVSAGLRGVSSFLFRLLWQKT